MTEYTLYDRYANGGKEITEQEALAIVKAAPMHAGPHGGMGEKIDQVLYAQDADDEGNETIRVLAVHYDGEWLVIPDNQSAYVSAELSFHGYDPDMDADAE